MMRQYYRISGYRNDDNIKIDLVAFEKNGISHVRIVDQVGDKFELMDEDLETYFGEWRVNRNIKIRKLRKCYL